jgi:AcrR family transcriptional regulator
MPALPFFVNERDAPGKRKIMEAALRLFVKDGLCETSVRDIAQASGLTNPALFKHFASKEELATILFERCYLDIFHRISTAIHDASGYRARVSAVILAYLDILEADSSSLLYVQDSLRYFWPRCSAEVRRHSIVGLIRTVLREGKQEGLVTEEIDLDVMLSMWVGLMQQVARARYFGELRMRKNLLAADLASMVLRATTR